MHTFQKLKEDYTPVELSGIPNEAKQWFRDSRFGAFIHFGLYSIIGKGEWVMFNERIDMDEYAKLADQFDVEVGAPRAWAKAAKDAGMKYMVLTARHHDGFSLFNTQFGSFNSMQTACGRDIVAEYVEACRNEGLKVGIYYSPMDWRFPGYFFPEMYFNNAMALKDQCWGQLRELMTNYGEIDILWFDGGWLAHGGIGWDAADFWNGFPKGPYTNPYYQANFFWESEKLLSMIRELQPGIMINDRGCCKGDFVIRERTIGEIRTDELWEYCDCLASSWGWIPNSHMLSLREFISSLVKTVVRDGNLLMNIGPKGDGTIERRQLDRLSQVGDWLYQYGHTVYGTSGGPFMPGEYGGTTFKDDCIYLHVLEWVEDVISLPPLNQKIIEYKNLTSGNVTLVQSSEGIELSVPIADRHPYDTIILIKLDGPVQWEGVESGQNELTQFLGDGLN